MKTTIGKIKKLIAEATVADDPALKHHLFSQDLSEDDAENANNAASGLDQVVRLFYKTPWEKKFYEMQGILSAVVAEVEKKQTGEA
jgi:hypothetical protein